MTPAEMIFSFKARTNFSYLLKQERTRSSSLAKFSKDVQRKKRNTWNWKRVTTSLPNYESGDSIYYYFKLKKIWVEAVIFRKISLLLYEIQFKSGRKLVAHVRNMKLKEKGKSSEVVARAFNSHFDEYVRVEDSVNGEDVVRNERVVVNKWMVPMKIISNNSNERWYWFWFFMTK